MYKLYECDIGMKVNGVSYAFPHVAEVQIEDPERNNITRGANASDTTGLVFREGLTEPKRFTVPIMQLTPELKAMLDAAYTDQTRCDFYCISRRNGQYKGAKNAILANKPQQLTLDQSPESLQVSIEFVTFESVEEIKP